MRAAPRARRRRSRRCRAAARRSPRGAHALAGGEPRCSASGAHGAGDAREHARGNPGRKARSQVCAYESGGDGEAHGRARSRSARVGGVSLEPRIDLTASEVPGLDEHLLERSQPALVVAGQVLLARQLLHGEAKALGVAAEEQQDERRDPEDAPLPALVENGLARLADDQGVVLALAAHVADGAHDGNSTAVCRTIREVSAIADYRAASEGNDIDALVATLAPDV